MDIGLGAALVVWFVSGVVFWAAFVVLGLRFRCSDEQEERATASGTPHSSASRARRTADQVPARTER